MRHTGKSDFFCVPHLFRFVENRKSCVLGRVYVCGMNVCTTPALIKISAGSVAVVVSTDPGTFANPRADFIKGQNPSAEPESVHL